MDDHQLNQNDQEDDIIGEEVRPSPIDTTLDVRLQALHALLQDHTYVQMPKQLSTITATISSTTAIATTVSTLTTTSPSISMSTLAAAAVSATALSPLSSSTIVSQHHNAQAKPSDSSMQSSITKEPASSVTTNSIKSTTSPSIGSKTRDEATTSSIPFTYDEHINGNLIFFIRNFGRNIKFSPIDMW